MMRLRGAGWTATVAGLVGGLIWSVWAVERVPFIGAGTSFLMSAVAIALIGCTALGLGRIAHRLLLEADVRADPQPDRGPWRATGHAAAAALLGAAVALIGGRSAYLVTVMTSGAGLAFAFVGVAVLAAVAATQVDRRMGPGGTRLDARRRGTAVGLMGTAAAFGLVYATGGQALLPSFEPVRWAVIGAAVFALLAVLQRLGAATPPSPAHVAQH